MKSFAAACALATLFAAPALADTVPPYEVKITLSDAAAAKLKTSGETITVSADYSAEPKEGVESEGPYPLGEQTAELTGAGAAQLGNLAFKPEDLAKVTGEAELNLNVYTSRKKFEDNLLDCSFFGDVVSKIPPTVEIACKLIGE